MPSGYKLVDYHGIELTLPASLPVTHSPYESPVDAVFAATNGTFSCPAQPVGHTTPPLPPDAVSVWLGAQAPRSVTESGDEQFGSRKVAGVAVTVAAPTRALVDTILGSIRAADVGHLGCPMHLTSLTPKNRPAPELVPGRPVSAVWCDYMQTAADPDGGWLVGSAPVPNGKLAGLVGDFDAMPPAQSTGNSWPGVQHTQTIFHYSDGSTRTIDENVEARSR